MQTNKLTFDVNFEALNKKYAFLRFTWQNNQDKPKLQWSNSYHLDALIENEQAEACLYRYGRYAYVMFEQHNYPDIEALRQKIANSDDYCHIKVDIAYASPIISYNSAVLTGEWLYQILFNALANSTSKRLAFHNLNGELIYLPIGMKKAKKLIAHKITLNKDFLFSAQAVTYQTKSAIYHGENDKRARQKKLSKPAYQLHLNALKRVFETTDGDWNTYIQAGITGTKATSDAISINSHQEFLQSRMGILHTLLKRFNQKYIGIISANWTERSFDESLENRFHLLNSDRKLQRMLQNQTIRLLDKIDTPDSQELIEDIKLALADLDIKAKLGKKEIQGAYHLCLIKSKDSYGKNEDPYHQDDRYIKQHITAEKYSECIKADCQSDIKNVDNKLKRGKQRKVVLRSLLKELWIKQDVVNKHIELFDENLSYPTKKPLTGTWVFGMIVNNNYHMIEVSESGDITHIIHDTMDLFPMHAYTDAIELISQANEPYRKNKESSIDAFIISPEQDVNIILSERESVIPDLLLLEKELIQKEASLPEEYSSPEELILLLSQSKTSTDEEWKAFINELSNVHEPLKKIKLKQIINDHFDPRSAQNKQIRQTLRDVGIIFSISKSIESLQEKMGDLFAIRAGEIDNKTAWYSVGYFYNSIKQALPHMVHLRCIETLKGRNIYQDILPLLDVDFVRFKGTTVLPFPIKHLRELIQLHEYSHESA